MAEKQCNLIKNGGGIGNIQSLVNIASSTARSTRGSWAYDDISDATFTLPKGEWLICVYMYMTFSADNNVWIDASNPSGTQSLFAVNPNRIAAGMACMFARSILRTQNNDDTFKMRISSSSAQTYTPYSIDVKAIKL